MDTSPTLTYPIPIFRISNNTYYLYDPHVIAHLRSHHRIPGVLTGTLPQSPQQNIFTGLPLQLMSEEARLLVEQNLAFVVDNAQEHRTGFKAMGREGKRQWRQRLRSMGRDIAAGVEKEKLKERERVLDSMQGEKKEMAKKAIRRKEEEARLDSETPEPSTEDESDLLFSRSATAMSETPPTSTSPTPPPTASTAVLQPHAITPTTSYPPFPQPGPDPKPSLPDTPPSYALYKYLHTHPDHTFYISPGLRFGCQYLIYPGDPLRFHSHFLAASWGWDEAIPLLTLVGGGRLGTGVKKGFLVGGKVDRRPAVESAGVDGRGEGAVDGSKARGDEEEQGADDDEVDADVRCFTIEWAGM